MSLQDRLMGPPGYCKRCGLIKSLVMLAMPGLHEDKETGELEGTAIVSTDPLQRFGYCEPCAIAMIEAGEFGHAPS